MKTMYDFLDGINESIRFRTAEMNHVKPEALGLDRRCAHRVWVSDECIIVNAKDDRTMQYYGGFEYVEQEYRVAIGDYVIYLADDGRVQRCIEQQAPADEDEDEDERALNDFNYVGSRHHY